MNSTVPWSQRPIEVANLLNPAYCALLVNQISAGYQSKRGVPLPYPLAFIALPLLMHPASVKLLPKTSSAKFHIWLQENPEIVFNFAERARNLAPYVRESIFFGISHKVLLLAEEGRIAAPPLKTKKLSVESDSSQMAVRQSQLVGKLLGQISDVTTLFSMFGVRP
jgi:hypothetical protein